MLKLSQFSPWKPLVKADFLVVWKYIFYNGKLCQDDFYFPSPKTKN